MDVLLEKLVDKGILTPTEASIIKDETKQQVSKELVEQRSYALPEWVQKIKIKGDLRVRYQNERIKDERFGDFVMRRGLVWFTPPFRAEIN